MQLPRPCPAASTVTYSPFRPNAWIIVTIAAAFAGFLLGVGITVFVGRGPLAGYEYHLWRWEADTIPSLLFRFAGIGPDPGERDGQDAIAHYFALTSQIGAAMQTDPIDTAQVDRLVAERQPYENKVERYVEGLIAEAIGDAGLDRALPLFNDVRITWPPVAFELTTPPQLLVRSPRTAIRRDGDTLLKPGLSLEDIARIEGEEDSANEVSLVVSIGGLAAYPAVVNDDRSFNGWLDTTSHEWVHHYLAFFPLGAQWGKGGDAEALNETTANLAGRAIADLIRKKHPIQLPVGADGGVPGKQCNAPPVDYNAEMRSLRLQVDALLAAGKVSEAESAMEAKRQFFEQHCIFIRKINQAFFAFYGTYADLPASSNPIGPKVQEVLDLTGNVGDFLRVMRDVTSVSDLDAALAALHANSPAAH